jgi:hypothetical protein
MGCREDLFMATNIQEWFDLFRARGQRNALPGRGFCPNGKQVDRAAAGLEGEYPLGSLSAAAGLPMAPAR